MSKEEKGGNMEIIFLFFVVLLTGCNYSVYFVQTSGHAEDMIDETAKTNASVDPNYVPTGFR